jgi:hypothetical protein
VKIGKRRQFDNLREIWQRETDFSDWLVTREGLDVIIQDIGI